MPLPSPHSRSGMSLMNVIILLMLIGVLVMAGYKMMGPIVHRGKINDTKTTITSNVDAIISWAVTNCRLPDAGLTTTGFTNVAKNPNDAWGNSLAYLYAPELASATSCAGICGINGTSLAVGTQLNVAFLILSSQYSGQFHYNLPTGTLVTASTATSGTVSQVATPDPPDISQIVTLDELKTRIGCFGQTGGRLRIVNNELPNACSGQSYSTILYPDGGISNYIWSTSTASWSIDATGKLSRSTPPTANETITITLSNTGTSIQRNYNLKVVPCGGGTIPTVPSVTPADFNGGGPGDGGVDVQGDKITWVNNDGNLIADSKNGTGSNCIWYQEPLSLTGLNLAAYFDFTFRDGEGFVFTLVSKTQEPPVSYCSQDLLGFGTGIPKGPLGTLLGVEFNAATQSICVATDGTICSGPPNLWTTDGSRYHVRIDLNRTAMQVEVRMCKHGAANCSNTEIEKLKAITAAYAGGLSTIIPPTPPALTTNNLIDLNNFYFGITAGQHDNNNLIMTISDLMVDLY